MTARRRRPGRDRDARLQGERVRHRDDRRPAACSGLRRRRDAMRRRTSSSSTRAPSPTPPTPRAAGSPAGRAARNPAARVILTGCYAQTQPRGRRGGRRRRPRDRPQPARRAGRGGDGAAAAGRRASRSGNSRRETAVSDVRRAHVRRPDAGVPQGAGGLRSLLHVLHRADGARAEPQPAAARRPARSSRRSPRAASAEVVLTGVHLGGWRRRPRSAASTSSGWSRRSSSRAAFARIRLSSIDPHEVTRAARAADGGAPARLPAPARAAAGGRRRRAAPDAPPLRHGARARSASP